MIKLIKINQTSIMCPSQWEGETEDGKMIYIRYRYGNLIINMSKEITKNVFDAIKGDRVFAAIHGDPTDGFLEYEELKKITQNYFELP